ncbi:MAG: DUF1343 domain-containing protein [Candidatus Marinimicrobia bacterium]|nr:DUF1343 domain-containing protein [Candidatus Neomarinimicrobiota bacterium]
MKVKTLYEVFLIVVLSCRIILAADLKYTKIVESQNEDLSTLQTGLDIVIEMKDSLLSEKGICFITNLKALYYNFDKIINIASILNKVNGKVIIISGRKYRHDGIKFFKVLKTVIDKLDYVFYDSVFSRIIINDQKVFLFLPTVDVAYSEDVQLLSKILNFSSVLKKKVYIVDFPNIFSCSKVDMPFIKFSSLDLTIPYIYGMTTGELAIMINEEYLKSPVDLTVVKMNNYEREMWYDHTGLRWYLDYMGLPSIEVCMFYIGSKILRSSNVETDTLGIYHFNLFGAPWINRAELIQRFDRLGQNGCIMFENDIEGVGLSLRIKDRRRFNPVKIYATILSLIGNLYPHHVIFYDWKDLNIPFDNELRVAIETGIDIDIYLKHKENELNRFLSMKNKFTIY